MYYIAFARGLKGDGLFVGQSETMKFSAFVGEGTTYLSANNICCLILIMRFEQGALTPCFELQSQNATENTSNATKERKPVNR